MASFRSFRSYISRLDQGKDRIASQSRILCPCLIDHENAGCRTVRNVHFRSIPYSLRCFRVFNEQADTN